MWLAATRDVAGALLRGTDTTQVLARVAARARDLADADVSTVAVVDDGGQQQLTIVAADGRHAARLRGRQVALEGTVDGDVLASGRAATTDLTSDDRADEPIAGVDGFGPAMCFPLIARGRSVGTLTVARDKAGSLFCGDDIHFAEGFAEQAALALDYGHAQAERRLVAVYGERDRIGHDLHDLVIQRLFAAGLTVAGVLQQVDDGVAERLDDVVDQIDAAIQDLRSSIFGLHARRGRAARLTTQIDEICSLAEAALGFAPACEIDPAADAAVTDELAPDLLAVARETLTNVARHAQASSVRLRLRVDDGICLEVADDGRGFAPGERTSGIANMRARAARLGGSLTIAEAATGGTEITWRVPLR